MDNLIQELTPLDSLEQRYYSLYHMEEANPLYAAPYPTDQFPKMLEQCGIEHFSFRSDTDTIVRDDIPGTEQCSMPEKNVFQENIDIFMNRHPRYNPPLLHKHDFYEIIYVAKGTCTQGIGQQRLPLHCGDFFILSPQVSHYIEVYDTQTIILNILVRTSTFQENFNDVLKGLGILSTFFAANIYGKSRNPYLLFHTNGASSVANGVAAIYREFQATAKYRELRLNYLLRLLFLDILRTTVQDAELGPPVGHRDDEIVIPLLLKMHDEFRTITLESLCNTFHYSESHLSKLIKQHTGHTFSENIRELRLQEACILLKKTSLSIETISYNVGYTSISFFYKIFKERYGMLPSEYRRCITAPNTAD